jgi:hypothetical protein
VLQYKNNKTIIKNMLIFDENNNAILLDSIQGPVLSQYMYVLDLNMMDFTLSPLLVFEEVICPTITLSIDGFDFNLPANWNILISDNETYQLDVVEISELGGKDFSALVYGMEMNNVELKSVRVVDYQPNAQNVGPALNKYQMLCHPINPRSWVNVAPSDSYNKYLKDKVVGDVI